MKSIIPEGYVPSITTMYFLTNEFGRLSKISTRAAYKGNFARAYRFSKFANLINKAYCECMNAYERNVDKKNREAEEKSSALNLWEV